MKTADFDFELPRELIAQEPLEDRSSARLLIMGKASGSIRHGAFTDITEYIHQGDCLVLNDTKVIPARLLGTKENTGAAVEIFLLKQRPGDIWECLVRPGKKLRTGARVTFGDGLLRAEIVECLEDGNRLVRFEYQGIFNELLDRLGEMPLPPYITKKLECRDMYQTVYARYEGSAAAPTAGLHFTEELLEQLRAMGVRLVYVTLHVGLGTFRPVSVREITQHHMHSEEFSVSREAAAVINDTKEKGGRVFCVGTTACRTVESAADASGRVKAGHGNTDIFIYPGYSFKVMDGLITNFHLPQSTLVMLVSALAGRENVLNAYKEAVNQKYRFFSFGDAMLIIDDNEM